MNRLGAELREAIVDCLADSIDDLRSCALASRAFLPRSRYLRFHKVTLTSQNHARFIDICTTSRDLAGVVRTLKMRDLSGAWLTEPHQLYDLLREFPRLQNLTLENLRWFALGSAGDEVLRSRIPQIICLRLIKCFFDRFSLLQSFLGTMPQLKDLSLEGTAYMQGDEPLPSAPKTKPTRLFITCLPHDTPRFLQALTCDQIREASFEPRNVLAMPLLHGVCEEAAGTLEYLHVRPVFHHHSSERLMTPRDLSLTSNIGLRSLIISGITLGDPTKIGSLSNKQSDAGVMFWLADILASARSPVLQNVEYQITVHGSGSLSNVNWRRISDLVLEQQTNWGACSKGLNVKLYVQDAPSISVNNIPWVSGDSPLCFNLIQAVT